MHDPFDRRVSYGVTTLVKGRIRNHGKLLGKVFDEVLDPIVRKKDLFKSMPFLWISLSYRYGIKNNLTRLRI